MNRRSALRDARFACDTVHRFALMVVQGLLVADVEELRSLLARGRESLRVAVTLVDALPSRTRAPTVDPLRSHLDGALFALGYAEEEIARRAAEARQ